MLQYPNVLSDVLAESNLVSSRSSAIATLLTFRATGAEKDKEAHELKRAVGVMLALKDFEEKCGAETPKYPSRNLC